MTVISIFATAAIGTLLIISIGSAIAYSYETFKLMFSKTNVLSEEEIQDYVELVSKYPFISLPTESAKCLCPRMTKNKLNTWLVYISDGWYKSFIPDMLEELKNVIRENNIEFHIDDISGKHGMLEIAYHPHNNAVDIVLEKYKEKSKSICVVCGDIATNHLWDINAPYCDRCKHELPDF